MGILDLIIILLVIGWLGGFAFKIGGGFVHILIVIVVVIFIFRFLGVSV